jgi:hypothetical protein
MQNGDLSCVSLVTKGLMRRIGMIMFFVFSATTAAQAQKPGQFYLLAGAQSPRRAMPGANYIGVEAGLIFAHIFRISAGVAHRVSDPTGPRGGTIFTISGGVEIPLPLF